MSYENDVKDGTKGLEAVSTGICCGCETCRESFDEYTVQDELEGYRVPAWDADCDEPIFFRTEEGATMVAESLFEEAWRSGKAYDEAHFSWGDCDICGSSLGGDREVWHAIDCDTGELVHGDSACVDCIMYLANGVLPDDD